MGLGQARPGPPKHLECSPGPVFVLVLYNLFRFKGKFNKNELNLYEWFLPRQIDQYKLLRYLRFVCENERCYCDVQSPRACSTAGLLSSAHGEQINPFMDDCYRDFTREQTLLYCPHYDSVLSSYMQGREQTNSQPC